MSRRSSRRLLLTALSAALCLGLAGLALAHNLSVGAARKSASSFVKRQASSTPGTTSSQLGACKKKSTHKVNCAYTLRGTRATGVPFSCSATAVVILRGKHSRKSGRRTVRKSGERCTEGQPPPPPPPPPPTGEPFFNGSFTTTCTPDLVPPCQQVKINGSFDSTSRGRQVSALKIIVLPQGATIRQITQQVCPLQLPDAQRTQTSTPNDTVTCVKSSDKPPNTVGSSEQVELKLTFNQKAETGTQFEITGRVDGTFQGPLKTSL